MSKKDYWQKFEENINYHIYNRGINGVTIFEKVENYHFFLRRWKELIHPFFRDYGLLSNAKSFSFFG